MNNDENKKSLGYTMLRNEVFAQGCLLQALASVHPDKETLLKHFKHFTEQYISTVLAMSSDDVSIRAFEMAVGRITGLIEKAQASDKPSTHQNPGQ